MSCQPRSHHIKSCFVVAALTAMTVHANALHIIATYDSTMSSRSDFAQFKPTIDSAVNWFNTHISDTTTINFAFTTSGTGLGSNNPTNVQVPYAQYRTALINHATSATDATAVASLPNQTNNPANNTSNVTLAKTLARTLGFNAPASVDDTIDLNVGSCFYTHNSPVSGKVDLYAVACHEIDEGLSSPSGLGFTGSPWAADMFRFQSSGVRTWDTNTSHVAYFSPDGGVTNTANYNQLNHSNGDWADWDLASVRVQNWAATSNRTIDMGAPESTMLDTIGWNMVPEPSSFAVLGVAMLGLLRRKK